MKNRLEKELMLYWATTHLDERKTGEIRRILDQNIDWDYILANRPLACITPLLFYNLKKIAGRSTIPQFVMDRLRTRYVGVLRRNTLIYRQLHEVLEGLQNEGIPVILLKGVALAETVYPDIALRPMSDIDFLVKETDLHTVIEVLTKLDYTPSDRTEYYEKHHHLVPYRKLDAKHRNAVTIEVHHNIVPEPFMSRINADCLWEGAQTVNIAGFDALILSPENLILHLCVHLSEACFLWGMKTLVDISESIRHYSRDLNWHLLVRRSNEFGVDGAVYYPLYLAEEMMYFNMPAYVLKGLKPNSVLSFFEARLLEIILRKNLWKGRDPSFLPRFIASVYRVLCMELLFTSGVHNKIGSLFIRAFKKAF